MSFAVESPAALLERLAFVTKDGCEHVTRPGWAAVRTIAEALPGIASEVDDVGALSVELEATTTAVRMAGDLGAVDWQLELELEIPGGRFGVVLPERCVRLATSEWLTAEGNVPKENPDELVLRFLSVVFAVLSKLASARGLSAVVHSIRRTSASSPPAGALVLAVRTKAGCERCFAVLSDELAGTLKLEGAERRRMRRDFPGLQTPVARVALPLETGCSDLWTLRMLERGGRLDLRAGSTLRVRSTTPPWPFEQAAGEGSVVRGRGWLAASPRESVLHFVLMRS